jgi:hypothetical protein
MVECQEVGARELADLVLVADRVLEVNREACGKAAVAVLAAQEVWEPVAPRVVEQGAALAADPEVEAALVRAADPEVEAALVRAAEPGLAAALVRAAEAALAAVVLGLASAALAAVVLGLALAASAAGQGLAARAPVADLAAGAGKLLEGGRLPRRCFAAARPGVAARWLARPAREPAGVGALASA